MSIELPELEKFIENELRESLQQDLRELKILKEADIECCAYYHLRGRIGNDERWRVFARKTAPKEGGTTLRYIDLLVFLEKKPCIAIKIKWDIEKMETKDRRSLRKARKNLKVKKAYFIVALYKKDYNPDCYKEFKEKYGIYEITVRLNLSENEFKDWESTREEYKKILDRDIS